ncbi:glucosamine-6-phosphate deaminase [Paenibacillus kribbensis]|uniref:Glucosamine-6-phosphate deaminase n=1 Tax=Paenibacillus kribbensis TaxID=172713 RepID=A0A222WJK5_9BACL|nr:MULTISPECIES: glucosamine-6-phosphate deaminase [Paenibacillus]ASR46154.1 glucosamine-6-phosphate deaminase [Paenibacillus kribbensis]EHS56225.1 glucosamine-6-phosphate deaminase (glucosamine-6-phosphate isomerase) [Paenibacillus sp. Aloe-11]MEC0237716.1 glucosamine-6-phosphate deaminase [Paenibacillus kribbensis]
MNIRIFNSREDLNATAAAVIAGLLLTKPQAMLGLATGSTPIGIYQHLADMYRKGQVSFARAFAVNLDEYVGLSQDHPQSYRRFMNEHLFQHIDIPIAHTRVPDGNALDLAAECAAHEQAILDHGHVDLQLLGIGHNGHIGFNEPGRSLTGSTHVVDLEERTRTANARFFGHIDAVPKQAITMGVGTILKAKQIVLVAFGADKADIIKQALTGPVTTECPASLLQCHPNVLILLDQEAGGWFN